MQNWELNLIEPGDWLMLQTTIGPVTVDCFTLEVVSVSGSSLMALATDHGEQYRIDRITGSIFLRVSQGVERRSSFQRVRRSNTNVVVQECVAGS